MAGKMPFSAARPEIARPKPRTDSLPDDGTRVSGLGAEWKEGRRKIVSLTLVPD